MTSNRAPATAGDERLTLSTQAARNLATTTKSAPQMQGISSRWLLRTLPWVDVRGGSYRVNRRLRLTVGRGRVGFLQAGADNVTIIAETLTEIPVLHGFAEPALLTELAGRFTARDFRAGEVIVSQGQPVEEVFVLAHGRLVRQSAGKFGETELLGVLTDGDHLGDEALRQHDEGEAQPVWAQTVKAGTDGTIMVLPWSAFQELYERSPALRQHIGAYLEQSRRATNRKGEAEIALASGHHGEPQIPGTYVDYEAAPREYELSVAQTVLRTHSRVTDLYNDPMNQAEEQLRLTVEEMREREEWELVNNREFGLLHNTDYDQRISTWSGPPTPDDLDDLLAMRRGTEFFFAHPKAIAAFLRECNKRGLVPAPARFGDKDVIGWRGVPILPCGKIPISETNTSSIIAMRTGEENQGVIGLHQTGIPDEYEPSLNVRFMGITDRAIIQYLVSAYYSVAVLVPDAIGVLENVEIAAARS